MKAEIEIRVTSEDIDDIMSGSLDGSATCSWCDSVRTNGEYLGEYASEQISRGGGLWFHDREDDVEYLLDCNKLLSGIEKWIEEPVGHNCLEFDNGRWKFDCCNADEIVCDAIIQYALFGEIVYG